MGLWQVLKSAVQSFREPVPEKALATNRRAWNDLPEWLKHSRQVLGIQSAGCGATVGLMERCDFYCTACYLPKSSQDTPPLPFDEVKEQVDMIADHLGPTGNIQLTAGEVTLLPREDLGRIVEYCLEKKLTPMVMTNGQTMMRDPSYLAHLMDRGLSKVAIHIDTTQRGRDGQSRHDSEAELDWIRDDFAKLVRDARKQSNKTLHAAHTYTVTRENQADVPGVVKWCIDNSDAFRLLSLQPTAEVGRTRVNRQGGDVTELWDYVCEGAGKSISREGMTFGHPDCNTVTMFFVVKWGNNTRLVEFLESPRDWDFFHNLLRKGFGSFTPFDESNLDLVVKIVSLLTRRPNWLWQVPLYILHRMSTEIDWIHSFIKHVALGGDFQINPFAIVVHNFMSADELSTEKGQDRLRACSFKVPYKGEMVSMCEFNGADMREANNQDIIGNDDEPQSPSSPQTDDIPDTVKTPDRELVPV